MTPFDMLRAGSRFFLDLLDVVEELGVLE